MTLIALTAFAARAYVISFGDQGDFADSSIRKVPISHGKVGVVNQGEILESAMSLKDSLQISNFNNLGQATLNFENGRLCSFERDGDETSRALDTSYFEQFAKNSVTLSQLWRRAPESTDGAWEYWDKSNRLRLWFFNPNGAGTLFAELAVILFAIAVVAFKRPIHKISFLVGTAAMLWLLTMTGSRGSFIAAILGMFTVGLGALFARGNKKITVVIGILCAIAICAFFTSGLVGDRFGKNLLALDLGNIQRIRAWKSVPAMLAAGPDGWGRYCGFAYDEWFQPYSDRHVLWFLVNTHLTWMVGGGTVFSIFYVFSWTVLMLFLLANIRNRWCCISLASWVTFFAANWFSTVGFFVSLWILPAIASAPAFVVIVRKFSFRLKLYVSLFALAAVVAVALVSAIVWIGKKDLSSMEVPVQRCRNTTYVGSGEPITYVVPDMWVLCRYEYGGMGRDVRAWCKANPNSGCIAIVDSVEDAPKDCGHLVLVGRACRDYLRVMKESSDKSSAVNAFKPKRMTLISPNLSARKLPNKLVKAYGIRVFEGEFLADVTGDAKRNIPWLVTVPACELYLPNWLRLALGGDGE